MIAPGRAADLSIFDLSDIGYSGAWILSVRFYLPAPTRLDADH